MSKKKEKSILSDKIAELIAPRRLLDPEIDSDDETAARAIDHGVDEEFDGEETLMSGIRKRNVKLLHDIDPKYAGAVSSRKDMDMNSDENQEDDEENDSIDNESDNSDVNTSSKDKSSGEFSMLLTPKQRLELNNANDDSDEEEEQRENESDNDDDIKGFSMKLNATEANTNAENSDDDFEVNSNDGETLEKWDDDYEGEEIDEEESENESGSEENENDDDESDFDGGDIMPKASTEETEESVRVLPKQLKDNPQQKGFCVQNQLQIWEQLLQVRIHLQKNVVNANRLPIYSKFQQLSNNSTEFAELANETEKNVSKLLSQMNAFQTTLLAQYPETKKFAKKRKASNSKIDDSTDTDDAKYRRIADSLEQDYSDFKEYQYSVISKWHDRTKVLTPGSVKSQQQQANIDILRKIEGVLANREELVKKSQLVKGSYTLFDKSHYNTKELNENGNENGEQNDASSDKQIYCTEIYDDADFYHQQLRELIEYKTSSSVTANDMVKQFSELQKLRKKMKKTVDTRASKGRKIRYVVHNKLVSFLAPHDPSEWTEESKSELFKSLFGANSI